ncbi:hypothetical protein EEB12_15085 [Rhodococcus sp. WS1]|uniref:hypothetical protein n=1 Tax=unclassified Rhodococcus (in: high G+C Gram-positive bacteria) TaxID=192944 RepID=UPI001141ED44|nr:MULTISPECIES: hypothetical protein [unclassified Rhodococcus (in: high G+C Gram-positive bacteria)]ROZ55152.1 hypothetical protein EEB12_15085 [Rhodococcus sp. WS1]TQC37862.1 hypothetical protein EEB16_12335 [Rhodococcus sp. WS7]
MDSYSYSFTEYADRVSAYNRIDADYVRGEYPYILERGQLWHRAQTTSALSTTLCSCRDGHSVLVELVPEPANPFDPTAVAVDFRDSSVGYLGPTFAAYWHPVILALIVIGRHALAHGVVGRDGDRPSGRPSVILDLPQWEGWESVAADADYDNGFDALWANLSEISRTVLLDTYGSHINSDVYYELRSNAHLMPDCCWNGERHAVPFPIVHAIRQEANREKVFRRKRRDQAKQDKFDERIARRQRAYEMRTAGETFTAIAKEFGVSNPTASALYREYLADAENASCDRLRTPGCEPSP